MVVGSFFGDDGQEVGSSTHQDDSFGVLASSAVGLLTVWYLEHGEPGCSMPQCLLGEYISKRKWEENSRRWLMSGRRGEGGGDENKVR